MIVSRNNEYKKWYYFLFILWPLLSFIVAIKQIVSRNSPSLTLILLFYALYGATYKVYNSDIDSSRHVEQFLEIANRPFSDFLYTLSNLYSSTGTKPDFLLDLLYFSISRFTDNPKFLFICLSFLLGLGLVMLLRRQIYVYLCGNKDHFALLFILFLVILFLPFRILSFRHYFASLVFLYFAYHYFSDKDNWRYLFLASTAVFSHFGFFPIIGLLWGYHFIGNKNIIYYGLIAAAFAFQSEAVDLIRVSGDIFSVGLERNVRGYTHSEYLENVELIKSNRNIILDQYVYWTNIFFLVAMFFLKMMDSFKEKVLNNIYSFSLLLSSFLVFTHDLESISGRFGVVLNAVASIFFINYFSAMKVSNRLLFKACTFAVLLINTIIILRLTLGNMNFSAALPLLPASLFIDLENTIWEVFQP